MRILLLDLEGTLHTREGLIPGALEAVAELRRDFDAVRFMTNTDSKSDPELLLSLAACGLRLAPGEVFSPVAAAAEALTATAGAVALVVAPASVRRQLAERVPVSDAPDEATHVVVGDCRDWLSYEVLDRAFAALTAGGELLALQRGRYFLAGGRRRLDTGTVVAALEYAAGVTARVVGKPAPEFLRLAVRSAGAELDESDIYVVGDDPTTDIAMGNAVGATTVQVGTGKGRQPAPASRACRPTHRVASIADVPGLLQTI
ncbi:MAG: HAD hydrolase-like protein [Propionibacteriaceae bacterium]|nr:HAD hydrolase-like protein [Propionibacteriaceae bacterium]